MSSQYKIRVENSAPSQNRPARSVRWAAPLLHKLGVRTVADVGCGRLRNLKTLKTYFPNITLVDTELQCQRVSGLLPKSKIIRLLSINELESEERKFDAIFLISVLHVVDKPSIRKKLLWVAREKLSTPGFLVIDVPAGEHYYRRNCTTRNRHGDGWVMGSGSVKTFYKSFGTKEIDRLIRSCTRLTLFKKTYIDKHIVRIWWSGA